MLKVYVAGASKNIERAVAFMNRIRDYPNLMAITVDWTVDTFADQGWDDAAKQAGFDDAGLSDEKRAVLAMQDMTGVFEADAFVCLAETPMSGGHPIELGIAIAQRRIAKEAGAAYIIVSGGGRRSIFTSPWTPSDGLANSYPLLVDAEVETDDEAWTVLYALAVEKRHTDS